MAKVLVVDDSLSVRKVVERALVARQLEVVSAASGNEAIAQLEREQPDLVVCDVVMPDRDGYDICRFVKGHPRLGRVPVLLISGIVNNAVLEQAAEARSDDVLRKPFEAAELVRKVSELLAGCATPATAPAPTANGAPPRPAVAAAPAPPAAPASQAVAAVLGARGHGGAAPPPAAPAWTPTRAATAAPAPPPTHVPPAPHVPPREPAPAAPDLRTALAQFMSSSGADWAALSDREGFLIESAGDSGVEAEVAAAMAACLTESSDGIGRELGRGTLGGMLIEYEKGTVLLHTIGAEAVFAVMLKDAAALGKVRYYVKRMLPDLARLI